MGSEDVWVETSGETAHGTPGLVDLREEEGGGGGRRSGTRSEGAFQGALGGAGSRDHPGRWVGERGRFGWEAGWGSPGRESNGIDWSHGICRDEKTERSMTKDIEATSEVGGPAAISPERGRDGTQDPRGSTQVRFFLKATQR